MNEDAKNLVREILSDARVNFDGGRWNHISDLGCFIVGIVASFTATILLADPPTSKWIIPMVAALPGLCAALQRAVDFRSRAIWYFMKSARLKSIAISVRHGLSTPEKAAEALGQIEIEMEKDWSKIGGSMPHKDSEKAVTHSII